MMPAPSRDPAPSLLRCEGLGVAFGTGVAVEDASFALAPGRVLGVVGESGSGKSQMVMALARLTEGRLSGAVWLGETEVLGAPAPVLRALRGRRIAYVFQDPMTALNPYLRLSVQLAEVARTHLGLSRAAARARALEMLRRVRLPDAERQLDAYPHELSGGMRQRAMIAMALMAAPQVLVADEPTTALDATVQVQVLDLLRALCDEDGLALILITHDMGVIARTADDVMVMYAGRIVERGPAAEVLAQPRHPYTARLLASTPDLTRPLDAPLPGIPGQLPEAGAPRDRCLFAPRCERARPECSAAAPPLAMVQGREVACLFPLDGPAA